MQKKSLAFVNFFLQASLNFSLTSTGALLAGLSGLVNSFFVSSSILSSTSLTRYGGELTFYRLQIDKEPSYGHLRRPRGR